jgi:hypothetical protein
LEVATGWAFNGAFTCGDEDEGASFGNDDDDGASTCSEEDEGASFGNEDDDGASACNEEDEGASFGDEDDDGTSACNEEDEGGSGTSKELSEQLNTKSPRSSAISTCGILLAIRNLLMSFPCSSSPLPNPWGKNLGLAGLHRCGAILNPGRNEQSTSIAYR